ncbi:uncharacterized protein LOC123541192 [Mercenaria mercenaria]|uniref:uncharacterized protein LOC123541192 n=1 Tax=Mercenaria mercenaria TaxID=6596 RepID=UPI00234F1C0A|nr:uncharacterized protein LOC123541192 [Mercenaria mercenaria]
MDLAKFICFLYIFAWLFAMASFLLPYWISGEIDAAVRNVTVVKEVDSGLLWKRQTYYMKADSIPDSDDSFAEISGTYLYTEAVKIVLGLMITGLALLSISLVSSVYLLCCYNEEKSGKHVAKIFIAIAALTILAGGFIVSGPVIYYGHVIGDYGVKKIHLGASWWLAAISAGITFMAGLLNVCQCIHSRCSVKFQSKV